MDAWEIFDSADVLYACFKILAWELQNNRVQFGPPSIVCAIFAAELYFKAILASEKPGAIPLGHDVKRLFNAIDDDTKHLIRDRYAKHLRMSAQALTPAGWEKSELDHVLNGPWNAFEKMRCFYEATDRNPESDCDREGVLKILREVILDLHPDWPVPNDAPSTFPTRLPIKARRVDETDHRTDSCAGDEVRLASKARASE